jgi:hypothetical protein
LKENFPSKKNFELFSALILPWFGEYSECKIFYGFYKKNSFSLSKLP